MVRDEPKHIAETNNKHRYSWLTMAWLC